MYCRCSFGVFLRAQIMPNKVMAQVIVNAAPPATEIIMMIDISSSSLLPVADDRPQNWSEPHDLYTTEGSVLLLINVDTVVIGKCDVALNAVDVGKDMMVGVDTVAVGKDVTFGVDTVGVGKDVTVGVDTVVVGKDVTVGMDTV